jgi:hypothetical protein
VVFNPTGSAARFGAFDSHGGHCFNEESRVCQELQNVLSLRASDRIYTRGRQFLRPVSGGGISFGLPEMSGDQIKSIVPWSRILGDQGAVLAINTDMNNLHSTWVG